MARQSPQRPDADEPELDDTDAAVAADEAEEDRPPADRALWDEVRIDPVEIALPAGTGFTLRAYRQARELTPTDVVERDQDDPFLARRQVVETEEDEEVVILDEEFAALSAEEDDEDEEKDAKARRKDKAGASDDEKAETETEDDAEDED